MNVTLSGNLNQSSDDICIHLHFTKMTKIFANFATYFTAPQIINCSFT